MHNPQWLVTQQHVRWRIFNRRCANPHQVGFVPSFPKLASEIWDLTAKALPAMINLKHLYFAPAADTWTAKDNWLSSSTLLRSFTFQLETLTWRNHYHANNGFSDFLRTQHSIIHLENGESPDRANLSWVEEVMCPKLVSVVCGFNSLAQVAKSRRIIAWRWYSGRGEADYMQRDSSALAALKYLSIHDYTAFRNIIGPIDLNIILLELSDSTWIIYASIFTSKFGFTLLTDYLPQNMTSLTNLPRLRVLIFFQEVYSNVSGDQITRCAIDCFRRLPSLEYIIQRFPRPYSNGYSFSRLSLRPGSSEDIFREEIMIDLDIGVPWWTVYNV